MKFAAFKVSIFILSIFAFIATVSAQDFLPELVRRIKPSAVAIETFDQKGATLSRGSGFFISGDKVITNRHVIENRAACFRCARVLARCR
jgi:S1-C subfamily serine protease